MLRKTFVTALAALALGASAGTAMAADPSIDQVYQAAQAGRLNEAEQMMQQVLRDHPESAKAHYVQAEILAREGRTGEARGELSRAQQIEPGLPFAKPQAVSALEASLGSQTGRPAYAQQGYAAQPAANRSGMPVGTIFFGLIILLAIFLVLRAVTRRTMATRNVYGPGGPAGYPQAGGVPMNGPQGPGYYPQGGGYYPPQAGGGIGGGILGGLATGAAMGAGVAAGEELVHHFTDDHRGYGGGAMPPAVDQGNYSDPNAGMGGNDFGVSDGGSWDDGSSGGGGMDSGGGGDW